MAEQNNVSNINYTDISKITGLFTAPGDILTGDGTATTTRLPVGTNGSVLTTDTNEPTNLIWKIPSPTPPEFFYLENTTQQSTTVQLPNYTQTPRLTLTISGGLYFVGVRYNFSTTSNNRSFAGRVIIGNTAEILSFNKFMRLPNGAIGDASNVYCDFRYNVPLLGGTFPIGVDFANGSTNSGTVIINNIFLVVYKIGDF